MALPTQDPTHDKSFAKPNCNAGYKFRGHCPCREAHVSEDLLDDQKGASSFNAIIAAGSQAKPLLSIPNDRRVVDSTRVVALTIVTKRKLIMGNSTVDLVEVCQGVSRNQLFNSTRNSCNPTNLFDER